MLKCTKCGTDNALGRVFCGKCGAKLDLQALSSEDIARQNRVPLWKRLWWIPLVVIVAVLLVCTGLALWPQPALMGAEGTRAGGRRVETQLGVAAKLVAGQVGRQEYFEKDINGYFQFFKDGKIGADTVRVSIQAGFFSVRMSKTLLKFGKNFKLRLTYDLVCQPVGGRAIVRKAAIGHLPAGPLRNMAVGAIYGPLSKQPEWNGIANITDIKAEVGKFLVVINKK